MNNTFFIAGTDTGVGKTLITTAFMARAKAEGYTSYGLKPVAAGCEETDQGLQNEDAQALQAAANVELEYSHINPIALRAPLSPHIAAAQEGKRLNKDRIVGYLRGALMNKADWRFVEGAGGWRVPIAPGAFMSDIPRALNLPVVLVVGVRLGCLNHATLTAEAIRNDGLQLAGWVANCIDPAMAAVQENIKTLAYLLQTPCLGTVHWSEGITAAAAGECLELPKS